MRNSQAAKNKSLHSAPFPLLPGDSKMRDARSAASIRTETAANRSAMRVDPTHVSTLSRSLVQPRGSLVLPRPVAVTDRTPGGAHGGASTPTVHSAARYELEDHRATTSAAASQAAAVKAAAARVASAEPTFTAPKVSPAVMWPAAALGPVAVGNTASSSAASSSATAYAETTAPPVVGQDESTQAVAGAGAEARGKRGSAESASIATEDKRDHRVVKQESEAKRSSALLRADQVRTRGGRTMRVTPRGIPPSVPPSSSAGYRSREALSAFSAASLCSSYDGESSWYSAPAVTVRSPASYFEDFTG